MADLIPADRPAPHELRTARLVLRRWRDEDRAPFAAMNADARVMEHFPAPLTRAESDALVERIERSFDEHGVGLWAIEASGAFVGFTGLLWQVPYAFGPALEVGWRLAACAWGHGYATEAAQAAIADGFARVAVDEIVSMTATVNARSRAVMERLGMRRDPADDFLHPRVSVDSHLAPHVLYRLPRGAGSAGTSRGAAQAGTGAAQLSHTRFGSLWSTFTATLAPGVARVRKICSTG